MFSSLFDSVLMGVFSGTIFLVLVEGSGNLATVARHIGALLLP